MSWITPKTDWTVDYRWDATDVSRIQNNLLFLKDYCTKLFESPTYKNMRTGLTYTDFIYARDFNNITENLIALNAATFNYPLATLPTFYANEPTPSNVYFNTVESTLQRIKVALDTNIGIMRRFPIRLGNKKGVAT